MPITATLTAQIGVYEFKGEIAMSDKHMIENIKEAIDFLEDRKKLINENVLIFNNEEKTSFSELWLTNVWQVNTDIEKLNELLHDYRYNPRLVSGESVRKLADWLYKKYGIDIRK